MTILEGKNLSKKFIDKDKEIAALSDISFTLEEGEILGIVGESGSGKSTLLKVISGLVVPDEGQLIFKGNEYNGQKARDTGRFLQYIFQNPLSSFDPRLSMEKSVLESGRGKKDLVRLYGILEEVGLNKELLQRKPSELSGGQCQRMSIARALYSGADILLCDEITSALDVSTQAQITKILHNLKDNGKLSAIFVSHDIALVRMLCDRVIVMKDGKCVEQGICEDLISNPHEEYTKKLVESAVRQSI
ncbi:ABC transporter ATP-binding protein [Butyrivibrio sp. INlla14]|uniref:ABC transporter ATP-binding protein n=1 Tax=Butyrivibrio sp. INlla14 TaxID=1520808 RepID=UPI000876D774|nr:dipeptide/oligopeptide/nickel ABC transporter ATP-binding protein [Butyrivibrio sp. INlla14]SCY52882.1 peptide/nickel transport system ATP-binding protein [Butyrivibrio sp. INlla14]